MWVINFFNFFFIFGKILNLLVNMFVISEWFKWNKKKEKNLKIFLVNWKYKINKEINNIKKSVFLKFML